MLKSSPHVSDLIFSPGRAPQVEVSGQLVELKYKGLECLSSDDTSSIAKDIMGKNETPVRNLEKDGSADLSYGIDRRRAFPRKYFQAAWKLRGRHACNPG